MTQRRTKKPQNILGQNIKALRLFYGIKQSELAERLGRDRFWLGRIERGKARLDAEYLPAIARILRCLPEELINGDLRD